MINYKVIQLGEMLDSGYDKQKIEEIFKKFSCQRETDLEDFLLYKAIAYERSNYGKTHLIIDYDELLQTGEIKIAAYFTISHRPIDISHLSKSKRKKTFKEYPGADHLNSISAYLIGQLGRCDNYTSKDLDGQTILNECYHAISVAARVVGGNVVILECRECMFSNFYEKQGYKKLSDELNKERLYMLYKKVDFREYWNRLLNS